MRSPQQRMIRANDLAQILGSEERQSSWSAISLCALSYQRER
jgi:hypothetical protein